MTILIASFVAGVFAKLIATRAFQKRAFVLRLQSRYTRIGELIHQLVVAYLLVHIGLVGGAEIAREGITRFALPGSLSIGLALTMFLVAGALATGLRIADHATRISLAAHFGSVSVGTFAATQAFLSSHNIPFDPSSAAWLTLMEIPSVLIGAVLIGDGIQSLKQILRDRDIMLLLGSLGLGYVLGPAMLERLAFVVVEPFEAVLTYFLFDMGQRAGRYIVRLREGGTKLILFGILMPNIGGSLGVLVSRLAGMAIGDTILLSVLSASASYVAATAVMGKLVSPKAIAMSLTVSLGVTLPWNILIGIPLYTQLAQGGVLSFLLISLNLLVASIVALVVIGIRILAWFNNSAVQIAHSNESADVPIEWKQLRISQRRLILTDINSPIRYLSKKISKHMGRIFSWARDGPMLARNLSSQAILVNVEA
jgi:hypothetical protein